MKKIGYFIFIGQNFGLLHRLNTRDYSQTLLRDYSMLDYIVDLELINLNSYYYGYTKGGIKIVKNMKSVSTLFREKIFYSISRIENDEYLAIAKNYLFKLNIKRKAITGIIKDLFIGHL